MSKEERFKGYYCDSIENIIVEDTINNETYLEDDIVKLLNQQDQKIADLEVKLARTQNELSAKVEYINELVVVKDNYKKQLTLTEKALELACKNSAFEDTCEFCEYKDYLKSIYGCPCYCETEQGFELEQAKNYFINKAKEIMKSE